MRITQTLLSGNILRDIQKADERRIITHERLSSGMKLNRPSDDPVGISFSLQYRTTLNEVDRYLGTISESIQWLNVTDSALNNLGLTMGRVRELAVQAANSSLPPESLTAVSQELSQLRQEVVSLGNTMYGDRYIFGGHQTLSEPFDNAGNYLGDTILANAEITREISPGVKMGINILGNSVFSPAIAAIDQLITNVNAGNTAAIGGTDIATLDTAYDNLLTYRSEVGAKTNRLELAQNRLMDLQVQVSRLKSDMEEADLSETAVLLSTQENAYRMALMAAGKTIQPTLLEFLR